MKLYQLHKTDENAEKQGVWYPVAKNDDGTEVAFRIRPMSNSNIEYKKAMEKESAPYSAKIKNGLLTDEESEQILCRVFTKAILTDWKNVRDENDKELPYSRDNALKLFEELPKLFTSLRTEAMNEANFLASNLEDVVGNSGRSCDLE